MYLHHTDSNIMNTHLAEVRLLKAADFAAMKHRFQRRKDEHATPYINHPIRVAFTLTTAGESDIMTLMAALLHDTIEDTETTYQELEEKFGKEVAEVVLELTDEQHLSRDEQRIRQIQHASGKSERARKVKLADKICNVFDILHHPPHGWSVQRKIEYVEFCREVVDMIRGTQPALEHEFDELYRHFRERFHLVDISHQ